MKLYHAKYILPALGVFLVGVTVPIWHGLAERGPGFQEPPNPKGERCIESKTFMCEQHMRLLLRWRDEVVRDNDRIYTATDGRKWQKSLKTCMGCHGHTDAQGKPTTAAVACNQCHGYVNAKLDCWNCHYDSATPALKLASGNTTARAALSREDR